MKRLALILLTVAINCSGQTPAGMRVSAGTSVSRGNSGGFNFQVLGTTPTSALLMYTPPSPSTNCTVTAKDPNGVLADDVNPSLFSGADTDTSRPYTTTDPITHARQLLLGVKGIAPYAADNNRHSRAMQAFTTYSTTINCGTGNTFTGNVTTSNIPLGNTHHDGWPFDRSYPGQYAYPDVDWSNLSQWTIDPMTGIASHRVPSGGDTASALANFDYAVDNTGAWNVGANFLTGGAAPNATISASTARLTLVEKGIHLPNAQSYANSAVSQLDWFQTTLNASASGACSGNDCNIQYCLGLGTTCYSATNTKTLTNTPQALTFGSQTVGDLWQGSGIFRPLLNAIDASVFSFTVNTSGTAVSLPSCWVPQSPFNVYKWKPGTHIIINSTNYTIASVQDECDLTLTTSAGTNSGVTAIAPNFGLIVWKQDTSSNIITLSGTSGSVGPQYQYGSQSTNGWEADAQITFAPNAVIPSQHGGTGDKPGYFGFVGSDLYWVSTDGSDVRDLGVMNISDPLGRTGGNCGDFTQSNIFDQDPGQVGVWYCLKNSTNGDSGPSRGRLYASVWKGQYIGNYTPVAAPGTPAPVSVTGATPNPSATWIATQMTPFGTDPVSDATCNAWETPNVKTFYTVDQDWGATGGEYDGFNVWVPYTYLDGVDSLGYLVVHQQIYQDSYGGVCAYNLGNRQPVGSGAGAMSMAGAISTLSSPYGSWGSIHTALTPFNGWAEVAENPWPGGAWQVSLSSTTLTNTVGSGNGQLQACPANAVYDGVHRAALTGNVCSHIITTGDPTYPPNQATCPNGVTTCSGAGGTTVSYTGTNPFQPIQVADVMDINWQGGCVGHCELVQVIVRNSSTDLWVLRGYQGSSINDHTGTSVLNMHNAGVGQQAFSGNQGGHTVWNYANDPTGANPNYVTIEPDQNAWNYHLFFDGQTRTWGGYQIQTGGIPAVFTATSASENIYPAFYGFTGYTGGASGNGIESHTGNGYTVAGTGVVFDGGAFNGGDMPNGTRQMVSGSAHPWTLVSGSLWACTMASGCASQTDGVTPILHPKILETFARSGAYLLLNVSGYGSSLGSTSADNYKWCYAYVAGQCHAGSAVGDVYVNLAMVPYYKYCYEPNGSGATPIAGQTDICIGDATSFMDQSRQFVSTGDSTGEYMRNLGTTNVPIGYWDVFANHDTIPGMTATAKWMRWAGLYSSSIEVMKTPPMPALDGVARNTYETTNITVPAHAGATGAYIGFGYARFGADNTGTNLYCTSTVEACIAAQTSIPGPGNANPFYLLHSDSWSPVACTSGCTIPLPLLPTEAGIFYQIHWTSGGSDVAVDAVRQLVTQ